MITFFKPFKIAKNIQSSLKKITIVSILWKLSKEKSRIVQKNYPKIHQNYFKVVDT